MSVLKTKFAGQAARKLRESSSDAERKLWYHLRNRQLLGFKFVRQQPVGPYVADFACREGDLIIELDGGQHAEPAAIVYDENRTAALAQHGYDVLRFWNTDVFENIDGVLEAIIAKLEAPSPGRRFAPSDLSPKGEVRPGDSLATASPLPLAERSIAQRTPGYNPGGEGAAIKSPVNKGTAS